VRHEPGSHFLERQTELDRMTRDAALSVSRTLRRLNVEQDRH